MDDGMSCCGGDGSFVYVYCHCSSSWRFSVVERGMEGMCWRDWIWRSWKQGKFTLMCEECDVGWGGRLRVELNGIARG